MCTLILAHRRLPGVSLAVSANRDELLDRPATPPAIDAGDRGDPAVLAPRDARAGGTWLGLNARGLFVGVTNRHGAMISPGRRSRGLLVHQSLRAPDAATLHGLLAALPADQYNGFHLVYADSARAFLTWSDGNALAQRELGPGLHIVTERSLGAAEAPREAPVRAAFEALLETGEVTPAAMRRLMTGHGPPDAPLAGACVHTSFGYGTRSSFQLVLGAAAPAALWTEGPACTGAVSDLAPLVSEVLAR